MTHTGEGDKCARWERGVTVDKPGQELREGEKNRKEVGWGKAGGDRQHSNRAQRSYCALNFACRRIQLCQLLPNSKMLNLLSVFDSNLSSSPLSDCIRAVFQSALYG